MPLAQDAAPLRLQHVQQLLGHDVHNLHKQHAAVSEASMAAFKIYRMHGCRSDAIATFEPWSATIGTSDMHDAKTRLKAPNYAEPVGHPGCAQKDRHLAEARGNKVMVAH